MHRVALSHVHYFQMCLESLAFYFVCLFIYLVTANEWSQNNLQTWTEKFMKKSKTENKKICKIWSKNPFWSQKSSHQVRKSYEFWKSVISEALYYRMIACIVSYKLCHQSDIKVKILLSTIVWALQLSYEFCNYHFIAYPLSYDPAESHLRKIVRKLSKLSET